MSAASERLVSGAGFLHEEMSGEGGQKPPCKCQPELEKNLSNSNFNPNNFKIIMLLAQIMSVEILVVNLKY